MFFELTRFDLQNEVRLFLHATNDEELTATTTPHPPIRQPASVWVVLKFFMLHRNFPLKLLVFGHNLPFKAVEDTLAASAVL